MIDMSSITFYFDPTCPFTWRTSRWIKEAASRTGEPITWKFLSLAILNEGRDIPHHSRPMREFGRSAHRVLAAADQKYGQDAVDRLFTALGQRLHTDNANPDTETLAAAITAAHLPADLIGAAQDTSLDAVVRASHDEAQAQVGDEAGSPVTVLDDGPGFFGPVVSPAPEGTEADKLLQALRLLSSVPQFSELKRARNPF
ncbi:disulfide bond formation protein DsbA [Micromonospora sp. NBC_01655]|uniref:DsbA family oxidoreductase n=1 Tax=Micromonospora sp. NBC_01655 TaxID=2975983 RepID=UPI002258C96E|nr:disulfide bond formation protein DsbA [Micromonospora sp. NBC_01655]MCX4471935.1 disulfide bond formation protein DsbA [Micromonospora sp. NBC_01655]